MNVFNYRIENMIIEFRVRIRTQFGENLFITGDCTELGNYKEAKSFPLKYESEDIWTAEIEFKASKAKSLHYTYFIKNEENELKWEGETNRKINFSNFTSKQIQVIDCWNDAGSIENAFYTIPFQKVLLKKYNTNFKAQPHNSFTHRFQIKAPLLKQGEIICLLGNCSNLHNWDSKSPVLLEKKNDWWTIDLDLSHEESIIQYKYGVYDIESNKFVEFEAGTNRETNVQRNDEKQVLINDGFARLPNAKWKGTGVSIPVFSLRSKKSLGIGEFPDLKLLVDWAKKTGLNLIQILPINDTTATNTWTDSYPYAAISAFALNPVYINLEKVAGKKLKNITDSIRKKKKQLNEKSVVDYETVLRFKTGILQELYEESGTDFLTDPDFIFYFEKNKDWLESYAAFCYLRDKYKTVFFESWKTNAVYEKTKISKLVSKKSKVYSSIGFYYFVQYHLHIQLLDATKYAHKNGIVLKGDIPIGIYRYGCDAWVEPELYNLNQQAGAPPDDFTAIGQNWGFPTYNWKKMQEDDFFWWRKRFEQMSAYFDSFRIDHILGFFRIWSIPTDAVQGLLGRFHPAIPISKTEFAKNGIAIDVDRFCKPYITESILNEVFGTLSENVKATFFTIDHNNNIVLKTDFSTQVKVEKYFSALKETEENKKIKSGLYTIISNVILFEEPGEIEPLFHFRISIDKTSSFNQLDNSLKEKLLNLYNDYFYLRQDAFWKKEALQKLPYLKRATNMLICGEDLGMVPHCVPDVMKQLGLLSLEIQRMPKKTHTEFFHPKDAPYLSVVSPSTHDMSTIRSWWQEDRKTTQHFFNYILQLPGSAPSFCEPWINLAIVKQHLLSPAMWSIFQWQDIMGISEKLRRENPAEERINKPANPKHYWQYRMHINLEDLNKEDEFNNELHLCIAESGR
jgi:4-alpha-glucanotransferase